MLDEMITENFSKPWQRLLADLAESAVLPEPTEEMVGMTLSVVEKHVAGDVLIPEQTVYIFDGTAELTYIGIPEGYDKDHVVINGEELYPCSVYDESPFLYIDFEYNGEPCNVAYYYDEETSSWSATLWADAPDDTEVTIAVYADKSVYEWAPVEPAAKVYDAEVHLYHDSNSAHDYEGIIVSGDYTTLREMIENKTSPVVLVKVWNELINLFSSTTAVAVYTWNDEDGFISFQPQVPTSYDNPGNFIRTAFNWYSDGTIFVF